jgi:MoCo/4Fe-4S cofactor protein with predicted Tat translocation signal
MSPPLLPLKTSSPGGGKEFWRSLEELAQTAEFQERVEREFAVPPDGWTDAVSRRQFLILAAASLGLAGLSGCAPVPPQRIVPFVRQPEGVVPGRATHYATAMPLVGAALGLLVESHEGRPTKVEGNPDHPGSPKPVGSPSHVRFGPTDVFAQASILSLYDPDRSRSVTHLGNISTWGNFVTALGRALQHAQQVRLAILTPSVMSPSQAHQLERLTTRFPRAKWYVHEPVGRENVMEGARQAFGKHAATQYRIAEADVIVALDADFLNHGPAHVRHLHDFASRRRVRHGNVQRMNRLYVVESTPSGTGAMADHRWPMRCAAVQGFACALATRLDRRFRSLPQTAQPVAPAWLDALARDLTQHRRSSLIMAGAAQPASVHALAHALNDVLGNAGHTVFYTRPVTDESAGRLAQLVEAMVAGQVDVLVILGGNPVYDAPADVHFAERLARVPFRVHLSAYEDETSELCHWQVPEAHFLESWGDVRAHDGTVSIIQPLIAPLYNGKTASEVLAVVLDESNRGSYEIVRSYWQSLFEPTHPWHASVRAKWEAQGLLAAFRGDFEAWWRKALHDGYMAGTQLPAQELNADVPQVANTPAPRELEMVIRPDPTIFDGRFANNGWLQELPKPLTKLTWDNAAYISPATAVRLGFAQADRPEQANEKVIELSCAGRSVEAPLWVLPGHANDSITVHLGYGRTKAGRVGSNLGFNAYRMRASSSLWFADGLTVRDTGRRQALACTQQHHLMENRDLVHAGTVANPPPVAPRRHPLTLYNDAEHPRDAQQWGMVIDLNLCTGCSACVVACQAENNIPVVGKTEVQRGREMHWLRIDRYFQGNASHPQTYFQPVTCMHCEDAPCEVVCPVGATVHSADGLNDMVYNRCVGTRYCSNNCPYKVRRFNFLSYADFVTEVLRLGRNPEVTVRSRGVMEKCTYCVQRIRAAEIAARRDDRDVRDGDVVTACQAACPAGAIVFGNLNDRDRHGPPHSEVARLQAEPWHYALLEELNTRPHTTYLAALKNPNPDIGS